MQIHKKKINAKLLDVCITILSAYVVIYLFSYDRSNRKVDLAGYWSAKTDSSIIEMEVQKSNNCKITYYDIHYNQTGSLTGTYAIDESKTPLSFSITGIHEINTALHGIIFVHDSNTLIMSLFSTREKTRPISLDGNQRIVMIRDNKHKKLLKFGT
jgi:hypothetical protein